MMASALVCKVRPALKAHTATMIFLHGVGDNAQGISDWTQSVDSQHLAFDHMKILYPTAPVRPFTAFGGFPTTAWFDLAAISPEVPADPHAADAICQALDSLVDAEVKAGIPVGRIVVGGFSMGGILALHYGLKHRPQIGAIVAFSSCLSFDSDVYSCLSGNVPPVLQVHGTADPVIRYQWGKQTSDKIKEAGHQRHTFLKYDGMAHEMCPQQFVELRKFLQQYVP